MWIACLVSFIAAALSIYLFFSLYFQHYFFAKNAILIQGKVVEIRSAQCLKHLKSLQHSPVIEYAFQGKRWRYCAHLDTVKEGIYLGRRLNLRVLCHRPAVVRSDLELIQRDSWVMVFAVMACIFTVFAAFLFPTHVARPELSWLVILTAGLFGVGGFLSIKRWHKRHYLTTSLTEENAHIVEEIFISKVSSQS
jgi:hypothetical protein